MQNIASRVLAIGLGLSCLVWSMQASAQATQDKQEPSAEKSAGDTKPTGEERYTLKLCNESTRQTVYGAVAVYDKPSDDNLTVHAWYKIEKGACANVATRRFGNYASHSIFVHGYSGNFVWPPPKNADFKLCVDRGRPYERMNSKNYTCTGNEVLRGFRKIKVERVVADDTTFTYSYK